MKSKSPWWFCEPVGAQESKITFMSDAVLVITATFAWGGTAYTQLVDTRIRVEKYMEGLLSWLSDDRFKKIVMVKNCSTAINVDILKELAEQNGKDFEFLNASESRKAAYRGKGYGEGEIIRFALANSRLLREATHFYKITGKLYCPEVGRYFDDEASNYFFVNPKGAPEFWLRRLGAKLYRFEYPNRILGWLRRFGLPIRLLRAAAPGMIDTRMFRVEKDFYERHLNRSYRRVQDSCHYFIEHAFFDDLQGSSAQLIEKTLPLVGTSGTTDLAAIDYSPEVKQASRNIARRLLTVSQ